jgi:hypothetical protein
MCINTLHKGDNNDDDDNDNNNNNNVPGTGTNPIAVPPTLTRVTFGTGWDSNRNL